LQRVILIDLQRFMPRSLARLVPIPTTSRPAEILNSRIRSGMLSCRRTPSSWCPVDAHLRNARSAFSPQKGRPSLAHAIEQLTRRGRSRRRNASMPQTSDSAILSRRDILAPTY
jgi:hypothetical protein